MECRPISAQRSLCRNATYCLKKLLTGTVRSIPQTAFPLTYTVISIFYNYLDKKDSILRS
jgi:hypothetical protein